MPANIWHAIAAGGWEGESSNGTLLVPADCFSHTYSWDQNILFFVELNFNCYLNIWWYDTLYLSWGNDKDEGIISKDLGPLPLGQIGRAAPSIFEMAPTSVNDSARKLFLTFDLKSSCLVSRTVVFTFNLFFYTH